MLSLLMSVYDSEGGDVVSLASFQPQLHRPQRTRATRLRTAHTGRVEGADPRRGQLVKQHCRAPTVNQVHMGVGRALHPSRVDLRREPRLSVGDQTVMFVRDGILSPGVAAVGPAK